MLHHHRYGQFHVGCHLVARHIDRFETRIPWLPLWTAHGAKKAWHDDAAAFLKDQVLSSSDEGEKLTAKLDACPS